MQLQKALHTANRVVEILGPHCDIIHIAGSVRRCKMDVKDIEIVCLPKSEFIITGLFGEGYNAVSKKFTEGVVGIMDKAVKGNTEGRQMQLQLKGGAMLDLFMPVPADYYRQFAIRTGSAEFASFYIAGGWKRQGWCGCGELGLRRIEDCVQGDDKKWKCINREGQLPPVWNSEHEFFEFIKLKWVSPNQREVKESINKFQ